MANYILLCHGAPIEFSSFEVPKKTEIVYWGAPGYLLPASVAWTAITQIRMNPFDLESINRYFNGLPPLKDRTLTGGYTYRPDLLLSGDNNLICILINLNNNRYALLDDKWVFKLSAFITNANEELIHLLCCTGNQVKPDMNVIKGLEQTNPNNLIPH